MKGVGLIKTKISTSDRFKFSTKSAVVLCAILTVLLPVGCADNETIKNCLEGHVYGFWGGLWHGIIAPFGLIGMLIWDDVAMYATNNNGAWYALGFLIGSGGWGVLASRWSD